MLSCNPSASDQNKENVPESTKKEDVDIEFLARVFPSEKLDNVVTEINQNELRRVITDGESANWKRTQYDKTSGDITIQNKTAKDNSIRFKLYGTLSAYAVIAVQQVNAQISVTEVWEYRYKSTNDHPEQWTEWFMNEYKLRDFFDERVELPSPYNMQSAKFYLEYQLTPAAINIKFNKWNYMRDMDADSVDAVGPLDPMLIKYRYSLKWNGEDFKEEKEKVAGYNDMITFTSDVIAIDEDEDGPGEHEFDCGHTVSVKASSTLPKQGGYNYDAKNVLTLEKAWSEGVEGDGVGEWLEFTITSANLHIGFDWHIGNGYTRTKEVWQANNRVKKFKVLVNDQPIGYVLLSNASAYQSFNISPSWLKDAAVFKKGTRIKFVIEEVYKGSKFSDTLISYLVPVGNCG